MVRVKICGITNRDDYLLAGEAGADMAGFVFVPGVKREVTPDRVAEILQDPLASIIGVGLFLDALPEYVTDTVKRCGLNMVQLQGAESPDYVLKLKRSLGSDFPVIKAFKVSDRIMPSGEHEMKEFSATDFFVFDTYHPDIPGGTGAGFDREVLKPALEGLSKPFFVAGGLSPENVAAVVSDIRPYGVDVSSGVENASGRKDLEKSKEFVENARTQNTRR